MTLKSLHDRWSNISRLWLGILMLGSYVLFLVFCIWWDQTITLERNALFALVWAALNLTRVSRENQLP